MIIGKNKSENEFKKFEGILKTSCSHPIYPLLQPTAVNVLRTCVFASFKTRFFEWVVMVSYFLMF
jgi:hypothetical protein